MLCDVSCGDVTSSCDVSCGVVLCGDDIVWCGEVRTGTGLARRRALFKTRTHHLGSGGKNLKKALTTLRKKACRIRVREKERQKRNKYGKRRSRTKVLKCV